MIYEDLKASPCGCGWSGCVGCFAGEVARRERDEKDEAETETEDDKEEN